VTFRFYHQVEEENEMSFKRAAAGLLQQNNWTHPTSPHTTTTGAVLSKDAQQDLLRLPVPRSVQLRLLSELQMDGS